jgi:hypothetical protein
MPARSRIPGRKYRGPRQLTSIDGCLTGSQSPLTQFVADSEGLWSNFCRAVLASLRKLDAARYCLLDSTQFKFIRDKPEHISHRVFCP